MAWAPWLLSGWRGYGQGVATVRALRPASENAGPSIPQLMIRCGTMVNQAESQPPPPKRCSPPSAWSSARPRISIPQGSTGRRWPGRRRRRRLAGLPADRATFSFYDPPGALMDLDVSSLESLRNQLRKLPAPPQGPGGAC